MPLSSAETPVLIIPSNPSLLLVKTFISNASDVIRGLNFRREPAARLRRREPEARPVQRSRLLLQPLDVSHPKPVRRSREA